MIIPMTSFGGSRWFTLCVSSQVGCRMGCTFCETGRMGLLKNLSPGELLALQARLYQVSQHIEVMSKVVDQMAGGIKTVLNTNV